MRNPLNIRQSLLALALAFAATTAFAAPPAKMATAPAATPATVTRAAPATTAKSTPTRSASHRVVAGKSHKHCVQRNKIGHCIKAAAAKPARSA